MLVPLQKDLLDIYVRQKNYSFAFNKNNYIILNMH